METTVKTDGPGGSPPAAGFKGAIDRFFGVSANGSTFPRELRAGLVTFLTMSYILFVNPQILEAAITDVDNVRAQLLTTTAIATCIGTLAFAFIARYPFAQAPGMGLNAFFTYTVVIGMGIEWRVALGAVFVSGLLFVVLSVVGVRKLIVQAIPMGLKLGIAAGIGTFLAFLGLQNGELVVMDEATMVAMGDLSNPVAWLTLIGLLITGVMLALRVKGAVLWGIAATTLIGIITRAAVYPGADGMVAFQGLSDGIVAAPVWPSDLVGELDIAGALGFGLLSVIFTFFFVDFFDSTGTFTGLAQRAGYLDDKGEMPRAKTTFAMDGVGTMVGATLGTSTVTAYVESASGIEDGGRTGVTSVMTGLMFGLAIFIWPLAGAVPSAATAPALIVVGAMMMQGVRYIEWSEISEAIPAFLTIVAMPLTFSIANGVSVGIIAYAAILLFSGKGKKVSWLL
ncbi:MAG TPA: NCS2 family permease, partial [Actinomycetaceae bacterium]|nr:NCS2 family permease [Actinomycetaceae bacterium]